MGYGGFELGFIFFSKAPIHITTNSLVGIGRASYEFDNLNIDNFFIVEPAAYLEFNVIKNFRIAGGATYRFAFDVDQIEDLDNGDLSGIGAELLFKIGIF